MISRLIAYYVRTSGAQQGMSVIWSGIFTHYHAALDAALHAHDEAAVTAALRDECTTRGMANITAAPDEVLQRLSEITGCASFSNPESGFTGQSVDDVLASVGVSLATPEIASAVGLTVNGSFVPVRAVYCAETFLAVNRLLGKLPQNVLEIGAGLGFAAWQFISAGTQQYTVIDLPTVNVIQGYVLANLLGADAIWLLGEPRGAQRVFLYPSTDFADVASGSYDLVLNQDSFPEIPYECVRQYLDLAAATLAPGGLLIEANQEDNFLGQRRAYAMIKEHGKFDLMLRCPFWTRKGYVFEAWRKI